MATNTPVTLDTPIVVKILFRGQTKKFKLPLKDLGAHVLPDKLRSILQVQPDEEVVFERYSDSAASYVTLDSEKPQVYKTLFRAAKAKLKLRLRATIPSEQQDVTDSVPQQPEPVPAAPVATLEAPSAETLPVAPVSPVRMSPVIACSPIPPKFEPVSPVSPPKPVDAAADEAPLPRSFTARKSFFDALASAPHNQDLAFRPKPSSPCCTAWVVYCNNCNQPMEDEHFHCSVCDDGDYDLCPACVDSGVHCPGDGHWMVKRFVKNGNVVNSTTQRMPPKPKPAAEVPAEEARGIPGAYTDEKQSVLPVVHVEDPSRTCNCCVRILPEKEFVTCVDCDDYDLCMECHVNNKHGHHPGHSFKAATAETVMPTLAGFLCNSGRNVRHSAVCDGCDKFIYGVRHKCLNCPDWDYCSDCVKNAKFIHPRHRFVPIYEPLAEPLSNGNRHYGIYCDGPLCKDKENLSYIEGIRFKCAVCHDTDFCQNCEAHPNNRHNHTHPLIKFKTPVRSVSVTTVNDDRNGRPVARLGDRQASSRSTATETNPVPSTNAATQVQTIVDVQPSEEVQVKTEKIAIRDLLVESVEPKQEKPAISAKEKAPAPVIEVIKSKPMPIPIVSETRNEGIDAHFIRDTILDGTKINSNAQFTQTWTLRNPGPNAWPAGCSVRHVGGDNMLNIDNTRPLSHAELAEASESNVVGHPVQPGEEMTFRVLMKAPQREGTAISYWRLKTAEGMPFGHRLWCDINVVSSPSPSFTQKASEPATAAAGPSIPSPLFEHLMQVRMEKRKAEQQRQASLLEQQKVEQQKMERQKMEHIQALRNAAVQRMMEARRREAEVAYDAWKSEHSDANPTAELPVQEEPVERAPEPQSSGMIFPQLDKESPESSTYEPSTTVQPTSPLSEKSIAARTVTVASDDEFFEDAESVTLHSDEEGFMTDEEYDILDASDEEMP